jgi:hypothetical protein
MQYRIGLLVPPSVHESLCKGQNDFFEEFRAANIDLYFIRFYTVGSCYFFFDDFVEPILSEEFALVLYPAKDSELFAHDVIQREWDWCRDDEHGAPMVFNEMEENEIPLFPVPMHFVAASDGIVRPTFCEAPGQLIARIKTHLDEIGAKPTSPDTLREYLRYEVCEDDSIYRAKM